MRDLRAAGVDVVTVGQYLRPTPKHHEVVRFVEPATFAAYEKAALEMGFLYAASGPLVRIEATARRRFSSAACSIAARPPISRTIRRWVDAMLTPAAWSAPVARAARDRRAQGMM